MSPIRPLTRLARAALGATALASLAGLLSPWLSRHVPGGADSLAWAIDLAAHWQWLFVALLAAATVAIVASGGRWRWLALMLAAPLPWLSAPPLLPRAAAHGDPVETLAIMSANVYYRNHDPRPLRAWVDVARPDVVVMVEISHRFARALEGASWQDYPHRHLAPRSDAFGVAVLSRHPLEAATVWRDPEGVGVLLARVAWRERTFFLAGFHPATPQTVRDHRERDRVFDCLTPAPPSPGDGTSVAAAIVAGDFNATPWSVAFAGPTRRGWRRATGLQPTWPGSWRGLMGIPIDHVLASSAWRLVAAEVGPDIGSDHLPVVARLRLTPDAAGMAGAAGTTRAAGTAAVADPFATVTSCLSRAPARLRPGA